MVQFIPAKNDWAEAFGQFGSGISQGYMNRADENAIRNALIGLKENASARDILDTVTNTKTYGKEAKQNALSNYLGVQQFEELQRKAKKAEELDSRRLSLEEAKLKRQEREDQRKQDVIKNSSFELIDQSDLPQDEKDRLKKLVQEDQLDPGSVKILTKQKKGLDKTQKETDEKIFAAEGALKILNEMRTIRGRGHLGIGSSFTRFFSKEASEDYGKYERLGKSLIQSSTNIPIRNRQEFEVLAHDLYDPNITDAQAKGTLDALEMIIKQSVPNEQSQAKPVEVNNERPPLSSFQR